MSTLEFAVLIGSVVLIAVVWLIPLGRVDSRQSTPEEAPVSDSAPALVARSPAQTAVPVPVPVPVPVSVQSAVATPDPVAAQSASAPAVVASAPVFAAAAAPTAPLRPPAHFHGAVTSTAKLSVSVRRPVDAGGRVAEGGVGSVTTSATPSTGGGAASQSAYPLVIPIPIAMSVATLPEVAAVPLTMQPVAIPVRSTTPMQSSSASASSLTWSSHPTPEEPSAAVAPWSGSQSVVARVSGITVRAEDDAARRRLLLAGAGLVLAFAVAARH